MGEAEKANAFQRKLNDLSSHKTAEVMYNRRFNEAARENIIEYGDDRTHGKYARDIVGTHGEHVMVIKDGRNRPQTADFPFRNPGANQTGNSPNNKRASWNAREAKQNLMRGSLNLFGG